MIEITDKSKCTGCNACVSTCPKHCIQMRSDREGFWYPVVKKKNCINCGLCERTCPVISSKTETQFQKAFAAYAKDDSIRMMSSSGGVFSVLAEYIIDNDGVVFGAAFNADLQVEHICVDSKEDLAKLRMSKYVQSSVGDAYDQAKKHLESKKPVFFTGTPCQIAGLKRFLNKDYDNLFTQDIVCHGVPSPWVWKKHIKYLESREGKLREVHFRNKAESWKHYRIQYCFISEEAKKLHTDQDLYFRAYLKKLTMRPSCYACKFKDKSRVSDITLADFWGIEDVIPEMDDDKGTTLFICNSEKGLYLLKKSQAGLIFKQTEYESAISKNPMAFSSANRPGSRDLFFKFLRKHNIEETVKLFCNDDPALVEKVQSMEDYEEVKREKGALFALLWKAKTH